MYMKKFVKSVSALTLALILGGNTVSTYAAESNKILEVKEHYQKEFGTQISETDKEFMNKFAKGYALFILDDKGKLYVEATDQEILEVTGFNQSELARFRSLIKLGNQFTATDKAESGLIIPYVHVSDWKVYFTYNDVQLFLLAAAQVGPAAMTAALTALSTMVSPGVGTVIGIVVGIVGAADLCYLVIQSQFRGQGIYIGIDWNGIFPNYAQGYWKG